MIHTKHFALACSLALLACTSILAADGDRYAFLVGVRQYDQTELTSLKYAENDITALAAALKRAGYGERNVVVLSHEVGAKSERARYLPLAKNIKEELALLLKTLQADDSVIVALAGHGVQFKGEETAYFCPMDAKLSDRTTLIAIDEIYESLKKCPAKCKVLLVDACRNDPQTRFTNRSKSARRSAKCCSSMRAATIRNRSSAARRAP